MHFVSLVYYMSLVLIQTQEIVQQTQRNIYNAILNSRTEIIVEPLVIIFSLIFIYVSYAFLNLKIETIGIYLVITVRLLPLIKAIELSSIQCEEPTPFLTVEKKSVEVDEPEEVD